MYASYLLGRQTDVLPVDRGRGFLRPRIMHEEKGGRESERRRWCLVMIPEQPPFSAEYITRARMGASQGGKTDR